MDNTSPVTMPPIAIERTRAAAVLASSQDARAWSTWYFIQQLLDAKDHAADSVGMSNDLENIAFLAGRGQFMMCSSLCPPVPEWRPHAFEIPVRPSALYDDEYPTVELCASSCANMLIR